jgi:hypothetical protein
MKNSLRYLELWQKKRNELPVNDNPQTDWIGMQALLDQHMPVTSPAAGDKPARSKGFKLLSVLFVSLSAAAMTYVVSYVVESKSHQHHTHNYSEKHNVKFSNDSASKANIAGSLTAKNPTAHNWDSLAALKQPQGIQNIGGIHPGINKKASDTLSPGTVRDKDLSASGKKSNTPILTGQDKNHPAAINSHRNQLVQASLTAPKAKYGKAFSKGAGKSTALINSGTPPGLSRPGVSNAEVNQRSDDIRSKPGLTPKIDNNHTGSLFILSGAPGSGLNPGGNSAQSTLAPWLNAKIPQKLLSKVLQDNEKTNKKEKNQKFKSPAIKNSAPSKIDWGILTGVNTSGSFTPKSQNANFYGSSPVDLYFGLFATYNLNDKWGINSPIKFLSPQNISGSYTHANGSKVDSGQVLRITDSRKAYFVSIPLNVVYKATGNLSFKLGPVINIPVKQINGNTTLQPPGIRADSAYYAKTITQLTGTKYDQKLNYSVSGGLSLQSKRFVFEATYLKPLGGYNVTSGFGSYKSNNGTFQFTIGFQLNKLKP